MNKVLVLISLLMGINLVGQERILNYEENNITPVIEYASFESGDDEGKIIAKSVKAASDYDHLNGFNLNAGINYSSFVCLGNSVANLENQGYLKCKQVTISNFCYIYCLDKFENQTKFEVYQDYYDYANRLNRGNYVVQGLTVDKNGNFLISAYHCGEDGEQLEVEIGGEYLFLERDGKCDDGLNRESIIIKYDSLNDRIKKIYKLPNENGHPSHVGGIAYSFKEYALGVIKEYLFVANGTYINIYKLTNAAVTFLYKQKLPTTASFMSSLYGYLWVGLYSSNYNAPFYGYQINHHSWKILNTTYYSVSLGLDSTTTSKMQQILNGQWDNIRTANYELTIPKKNIQGVYGDSAPALQSRLNFYFSASNNTSYVYQATLDTKDTNNDGIINGEGGTDTTKEWFWESFFTPYQDGGPSLPDGGEGIVKDKNGQLYMLNEGASKYYCEKWDVLGDDPIDCARELLKIDNLKNSKNVFNNGRISFSGTGINNDIGVKVALIIGQNKIHGMLYYALGKFVNNQIILSKTHNYSGYNSPLNEGEARISVEDVKAIYIMNLAKCTNGVCDSDDWTLTKLRLTFDSVPNYDNGDNYAEISTNKELGDDINDGIGYSVTFNTYFENNNANIVYSGYSVNTSNNPDDFYQLQQKMQQCYNVNGDACFTDNYLLNLYMNNTFFTYFENSVVCDLVYWLNFPYFVRKTPFDASYFCPE